MSSGMGWLGIDGLAAAGAAGAGAGADAGVADAAAVAPFACAGVCFASEAVEGPGDGDGLAGGVARGVFRLVALVRVGCIVGGRTAIGAAAPLGGDPAGGRTGVGVGGSVDANISPE